jgi:parallel beta-helix repeat protein
LRLFTRRPARLSFPMVAFTAVLAATFLSTTVAITAPSEALAGTTLYAKCDGVSLRTKPKTASTRVATLSSGGRVNAVSKVTGASWTVTCGGTSYSGNTWYRINNVNGRSASSRYGVTYVYSVTARFTTTPPASSTTQPASCGSSLQAKVDATSSGGTLDLSGCSYSAGATIARSMTLVGATVRVPAGQQGIRVSASNVTLARVTVIGPQATAYRGNEYGVLSSGSISNLVVRDSIIKRFGNSGIWVGPVKGVTISRNTIEDTVYSGIMLISASGGKVSGNTVRRIGVVGSAANDGNAYGIAVSNTGGAVSADIVVDGNRVATVPTWHGLDTHAGLRITFSNNTVSGSPRALFITADASGRRSTDIIASGNTFLSPAPAVTNLITVTTYKASGVDVVENSSSGWGGAAFFHDYNGLSSGLVVKNNSIDP